MDDPLKNFRETLKTLDDIVKRMEYTEDIRKHLSLISTEKERALYRAEFDGSYWIEEYPCGEMWGGCLYLISTTIDDPDQILKTQPYLTEEIMYIEMYIDEARRLWEVLGEEIGPETCKKEGCLRKRIKLSVFCKVHHFENTMKMSGKNHVHLNNRG